MQLTQKNYLGIDVSKPWFDVSLLIVVNHQKQPMITYSRQYGCEGNDSQKKSRK